MHERSKRAVESLPPVTALIGKPSDPDRLLVVTMSKIAETSGAMAPKLFALIERRAPACSAIEAADFVLGAWSKGGQARDQLVARAMQTSKEVALIAELQAEIQRVLKPLAGRPFDQAQRMINKRLRRALEKRWPSVDKARLASSVSPAVRIEAGRMVVKVDEIVRVLAGAGLAS